MEFGEKTQPDTAAQPETASLAHQAGWLSRVFEYSGEAIFLLDPERDQILEVNPKACQILGYTRQELCSTPISTLCPHQMPQLQSFTQTVFEQGHNRTKVLKCLTRGGHFLPVEMTGVGVEMAGRSCLLALAHDLSEHQRVETEIHRRNQELTLERQRLEEQYHQAQKMEAIGRLTAGIAHDFNNMLTAINGFAELVRDELLPDDPLWEMVDKILCSGRRATDLVRQLLVFSRRQVIKPQVLNLNGIVGEMNKMLRRIIGEDIDLRTVLAPDLGLIKADTTQLEQVILNLAINARDAMPEGGRLIIETSNVVIDEHYVAGHLGTKLGEYVLLAISDTGSGMGPEVKTHLFEPFFTTKAVGKGTGLGLATVFGIVKQNQGDIWVYSEEGLGTTFKIYLPRVETTSLPLVTASLEAEPPGGSETILLVEDDLSVREVAQRVLQRQGYTLIEAQNGREALRLATYHPGPIDLLLTDVIMPGMNGKELAREMSHLRPSLKTLFISGYTDETIAHHGVLDQGVDFLQKPFGPATLAHKVREVLDR